MNEHSFSTDPRLMLEDREKRWGNWIVPAIRSPAMSDQTIGGLLHRRAAEKPDQAFLWCDDAWMSYDELVKLSDRFAGGLQRLGVTAGDRVAMVLPTERAAVVTVFACARLGAIQVALNTFLRGEFLIHQMRNSRASTVVTDKLGAEQILRVVSDLPDLRTLVFVGDMQDVAKLDINPLKLACYDQLIVPSDETAAFPEVAPQSIFSILYTSGTTGMPKGCMMSHRYATNMARVLCGAGRFSPGDRVLTASPLFHTGGQIFAMMSALHSAGSIAFVREFHASTFMALARQLEATVLFGPGAVGVFILAQPVLETDRDHKVRQAVFNGLPEATQLALEDRFGFHVVGEMYGHSEFIPIAISPVQGPRRRDSGGSVPSHVEVRIVDDSDQPLPAGATGEIVARPRECGIMFDGYWDNPQATVDTWRNLWHHTGDLGRFDADGFLHFAGRKKEAIRRRGEFVTDRELEAAILKHPGIAAAAVHAVPSEITEDEIKAWLVLKPAVSLTPGDLFAYLRAELPYYAIPRFIEIVGALPMNHNARVMKHELKARPNGPSTWDLDQLGLVVPRDERRA